MPLHGWVSLTAVGALISDDLMGKLTTIGVSALLSLFTFLFVAWIRSQMSERLLEMQLRFTEKFVAKDDLNAHLAGLKEALDSNTSKLGELQRIVDRRWGDRPPNSI